MMPLRQLSFAFSVGLLLPCLALAQPEEGAKVGPLPALFAGVVGGTIDVSANAKREVDKKGKLIGFELSGRWPLSEVYVGAGYTYLYARTVGSDSTTSGEQEAQLNTSVYDLNVGYTFGSAISTGIGVQVWASNGSNFAPKSEASKHVKYWCGEIGIDPGLDTPISLVLRYARSLEVEDRRITIASLGVRHQLDY